MTPPSVVLLAVAIAVAVAVIVFDGIKEDLGVYLTRALAWLVRFNAKHLLPKQRAEEFIFWFDAELDEVISAGGSGMGVAAVFLLFTGPYSTWTTRRRQGQPK